MYFDTRLVLKTSAAPVYQSIKLLKLEQILQSKFVLNRKIDIILELKSVCLNFRNNIYIFINQEL